jgi:hypothetical protein
MDCPEIEAAILRGGAPPGAGLDDHLAECPSCRYLIEGGEPVARALAGSASDQPAIDLAALVAATEGALARERGPLAWLRARSRPERAALVVLAMALAVGVFVRVLHLRADWGSYPAPQLGIVLGGLGALALAATWHALRPLYLPPAPARLLLALGIAAPIVAALLPEQPTTVPLAHGFAASALACFALGSVLALAVFLAARALARDRLGALAAAVGAGLAGVLGLVLHCPNNAPGHLLLGHAAVPIALVLLGQAAALRRARP